MSTERHLRAFRNLGGIANSRSSRPPVKLPEPDIRISGWNPVTSYPWDWVIWAEANRGHGVQGWTPPADGAGLSSWPRLDLSPDIDRFFDGSGTYHTPVSALNNRAGVTLTGTPDVSFYQTTTTTPRAQPFTVVMVFDYADLTNGGWLFNTQPTGSGVIGFGVTSVPTPPWQINWGTGVGTAQSGGTPTTGKHFAVAVANGASSRLTVDGVTVIGPVNAGTAATTTRHIIASFNENQYNLDGDIAFAGLLGRLFTPAEEARLLAWSRSDYATP